MKGILLQAVLLCLCGTAAAQSGMRPRLHVERQQDNCCDFYLYFEDAQPYYGTMTVLIDFSMLENCTQTPGIHRYEVRCGGTPTRVRVMSLRPADASRPIRFRYSAYRCLFGRIDSHVDTTFVYLCPTPAGRSVAVRRLSSRQKSGQRRDAGLRFAMQYGDTVCAMRRGRVVRIEQGDDEPRGGDSLYRLRSRRITVEHPDGSMIRYSFRRGGRLLVREGEDVLPSQPIGIAGVVEELACAVEVTCYRLCSNPEQGEAGKPERHLFIPRLATAEGVVVPESETTCTSVVTDEVLSRELSKREIRRLREKRR